MSVRLIQINGAQPHAPSLLSGFRAWSHHEEAEQKGDRQAQSREEDSG
jgi:hypothetical protein